MKKKLFIALFILSLIVPPASFLLVKDWIRSEERRVGKECRL